MKKLLPLICVLFASLSHAQYESAGWANLSGGGDEIELAAGETAFIVTVSKPVYLVVNRPSQYNSLSIRLRQRDPKIFYESISQRSERRNYALVDWKNPFPISGPCTIRLSTPAIVSMRITSPPPAP
ncbi:MAG: hypothetical protein ACPG4K_11140 [Haloferula sp.]